MTTVVALFISGAALGVVYGLIAMGYVLIFKASDTVNFAHGALMLLGAYLAFQFGSQRWGMSFGLSILLAAAITGLCGLLLQFLVARPLIGSPPHAVILATVGIDISLRALIGGREDWTLDVHEVGSPWLGSVSIGDITFPESNLWIMGASISIMVAVTVGVQRSSWGLAMRAAAEDQEVARVLGIPVKRLLASVWILSAVLVAIAGVFATSSPRLLEPVSFTIALRALPAAVIGGFDSLNGAILGGLVIGWAEVYAAAYQPAWLGTNFHLVFPYVLMLVVLLIRPQGFLGRPEVVRV